MDFKNAKVVGYDDEPQKKEVELEKKDDSQTENNDKETVADDNQQDESSEKGKVETEVENKNETDSKEVNETNEVEKQELSEDDILKFLKDKKGIEVDNLDSLNKQEQQEIPEDLKKFLEYKKETNRDYKDYLELQKDWSNEDEDTVLSKYLKEKNPLFDNDDIKDEISELEIDEDIDEENDIKKKKRKKKKLLNEALNYLNAQKEKYKQPKEGSSDNVEIPKEYRESKEKLSEIMNNQQEFEKLNKQRYDKFIDESKQIFNEEFKGFEFDINGDKKVFKPAKNDELFEQQSDIHNFINKFTDENGAIKNVKGYHKALSAGMNAEALAKHFYELGQQEAITNETKDSKNINFENRKPQENHNSKPKYKVVNGQNSFGGYKLKY